MSETHSDPPSPTRDDDDADHSNSPHDSSPRSDDGGNESLASAADDDGGSSGGGANDPDGDASGSDHASSSRRRSNSQRRSTQNLSPSARRSSARLPLIAAVKYPKRDESLTVVDFLDTSKPLVHSTAALTQPRGPSFVEHRTADVRKLQRAEQRRRAADASQDLTQKLSTQRKYLKARYEFDREKKQAELAIYHKERTAQWAQRLASSPFGVDLVADNERIEEEVFVRAKLERQRRAVAERKRQKLKNQIIVRALAEVPLLEEARRQKRRMIEDERRERALRDVQRVEAVQERKVRDQQLLTRERQAKNDQRHMLRSNSPSTP